MPRGNEGKPANASNMKENGSQHEMSSAALPMCREKFEHVLKGACPSSVGPEPQRETGGLC